MGGEGKKIYFLARVVIMSRLGVIIEIDVAEARKGTRSLLSPNV